MICCLLHVVRESVQKMVLQLMWVTCHYLLARSEKHVPFCSVNMACCPPVEVQPVLRHHGHGVGCDLDVT